MMRPMEMGNSASSGGLSSRHFLSNITWLPTISTGRPFFHTHLRGLLTAANSTNSRDAAGLSRLHLTLLILAAACLSHTQAKATGHGEASPENGKGKGELLSLSGWMIHWCLVALALNVPTQSSGADEFSSFALHSLARISPLICLADMLVLLSTVPEYWRVTLSTALGLYQLTFATLSHALLFNPRHADVPGWIADWAKSGLVMGKLRY